MTNKTKLVTVTPRVAMLTERDVGKTPVLECIDLGISFGGLKAVDNFNITIGRTEIAGLIGPNGAGKTCSPACTSPPTAPSCSTARTSTA